MNTQEAWIRAVLHLLLETKTIEVGPILAGKNPVILAVGMAQAKVAGSSITFDNNLNTFRCDGFDAEPGLLGVSAKMASHFIIFSVASVDLGKITSLS